MIRVVAAVIEVRGRVLICRRKNKDGSAGKWEFPGGKLEPGETEQACLARELSEELCIRASAGKKLAQVRHDYEAFAVDISFYSAQIVGGTLRLMVHADAVWARKKELPQYDFLAGDVEFVKQLAEGRV